LGGRRHLQESKSKSKKQKKMKKIIWRTWQPVVSLPLLSSLLPSSSSSSLLVVLASSLLSSFSLLLSSLPVTERQVAPRAPAVTMLQSEFKRPHDADLFCWIQKNRKISEKIKLGCISYPFFSEKDLNELDQKLLRKF
jgi:hypothetical protein